MPRLLQPVSALDELNQSFDKPRCRRAIYYIVVEGNRQIEHVARFDAFLDDGWLAGDATHDQEDRLPGRRQPPTTTATGHAQRGDTDRASCGCQTRRIAVAHGAAYYGLVRRGQGVRIGGGSARAYYLGIGDQGRNASDAVPTASCSSDKSTPPA